jgi:trehalose 6-phosphate phosphatase
LNAVPGVLGPLVAEPGRAALLTDFDGTLSSIVDDPSQASPLPGAPGLLRALSGRLAVVGVVSGRPVEFLLSQFGGDPGRVRLAGLYGLEVLAAGEGGGEIALRPGVEPWAPIVDEVARQARDQAPSGADVEHKGLTLTLHWRRAPEAANWATGFATTEAGRTGLCVQEGRMSLELRPPVQVDKGTPVSEWCEGLGAACFLGDDRGDLAAFTALDHLHEDQGLKAVKVAAASSESPAELLESADLVVEGPGGVVELLAGLVQALG